MIDSSKDHLTRQSDLIPMDTLDQRITVVGAGAVGSWVVICLTKMGLTNVKVFDDDIITIENMNSQCYPYKGIGEAKVKVLRSMVKSFANTEIEVVQGRYEDGMPLEGIVISAVDSMGARKLIWENAKKKGSKVEMVIDPRMGAETSLLYIMNPHDPKDVASYEKTLYSDKDAVQERCTAKATIYCANLLAGQVVKGVKDLVCGTPYTRLSQWDIGKNHVQMWTKKTE